MEDEIRRVGEGKYIYDADAISDVERLAIAGVRIAELERELMRCNEASKALAHYYGELFMFLVDMQEEERTQ